MIRAKFALLLLTGVVAATGCRMCANPYDCYGPTWLGQPGEPTWEFERAGSAFSGHHGTGYGEFAAEGEYESVPAENLPAEMESSPLGPPMPQGYYPEGMTAAPQHTVPRQGHQPSRSALRQTR